MPKSLYKSSHKKDFYIKSAEIFKIMSNPKRLEILDIIKDREVTVNEISKILGTRKSNTSQHLAYLRYVGVVIAKRVGKNIFYRLVDPKIIEPAEALASMKINKFLS